MYADVDSDGEDESIELYTSPFFDAGNERAEFVEDYNEKVKALNIIMEKYSMQTKYEYAKELVNNLSISKVEIIEITGKKSGY